MTHSTSAPLSWDRQSGAGYRSDLLSLEECTGLCVSVATDEVAVVLIGHDVCDLLLAGSHSADKAADGVLFLRTDELPVVRWGLGGRQATARLRVLEASLFYDTFLRHSEDLEQVQLDLILSCLLAERCVRWIDGQGGLEHMAAVNKRKADKLYACIDSSNYYHNPINVDCRSWMNVPFTLPSSDLDGLFLRESADEGLVGLKGHRFVGGMRASIYNAMPEEGVDQLIAFMGDFMQRHA